MLDPVDHAPKRHNNAHFTQYPQRAWRAFSLPGTSLPQPSKTQLPLRGSFYSSVYPEPRREHSAFLATPLASSPVLQHETPGTQQPTTKIPDPARYTLEDGPRDAPGTAAYYKSWSFRTKVKEGTTLVTEQEEGGEDLHDSADEDYIKKPKQTDKAKSLVMVFSRTNVRRASAQRKVNERMQRSNRRMNFLRKLESTKPLFEWD